MQEVLIDVTRLLHRFLKGRLPTGVDRVSLAYIGHFSSRARAVVRWNGRSLLIPYLDSQQLFGELLHPGPHFRRTVMWIVFRAGCRVQLDTDRKGLFLFNTGHSGLEQSSYPKKLRKQGVKPLFMVHDLIPITHPEYCRAGESDVHVVRMDNVLQIASGIIANSRDTLDELTRYARRTGQFMPPAVAARLAAATLPPPRPSRPMSSPYFLMLGTIEARKNHWLLLQIWRQLAAQFGRQTPKLVLVGQRGWECENVVDLLERCVALKDCVIELPDCSDVALSTYISHAQALLFPSFAEGYGMPLMEALSSGVPVIASDLPVFREIAGDIPDYLDPMDGLAWLSYIKNFSMPDSVMRKAQIARMSAFVAPTWTTHFQLVEEMMGQLA